MIMFRFFIFFHFISQATWSKFFDEHIYSFVVPRNNSVCVSQGFVLSSVHTIKYIDRYRSKSKLDEFIPCHDRIMLCKNDLFKNGWGLSVENSALTVYLKRSIRIQQYVYCKYSIENTWRAHILKFLTQKRILADCN